MPFDQFRLPAMPELPKIPTQAEGAFEAIRDRIVAFQRELDDEHELGLMIPGAEPLHVERIAIESAFLLAFYGTTRAGLRTALLQHVSQTNLMLIAVPKSGPVARRVGFEVPK